MFELNTSREIRRAKSIEATLTPEAEQFLESVNELKKQGIAVSPQMRISAGYVETAKNAKEAK